MRVFRVIVNDGKSVFESYAAAKSRKEMINIYGGNGEFEVIQDITKDIFTEDSPKALVDLMRQNGWGRAERELVYALMQEHIAKTHSGRRV